MAQLIKNPPAMRRPGLDPRVGKIPWRTERLPTPVFWPGEFHGLYSPWGRKESDSTFNSNSVQEGFSVNGEGLISFFFFPRRKENEHINSGL